MTSYIIACTPLQLGGAGRRGGEKGRGEGAGGEVTILENFYSEIFIVVGSYIVGRVSFGWGMGGGRT